MKHFQLLFALLVVITISGGILAFKAAKKVDIKSYYFTGASKAINTLSASSLVQYQVTNPANYTTVQPSGYALGNGNFYGGLIFDEDYIALTVALSSVWNYYAATGNLPPHAASLSAGIANVTIIRKTDTN